MYRRIAVLCLLFIASPTRAIDFYVAPGGDDRNPGTMEEPLRTIAKARDLVRGRKGDVNVVLRGGTYQLEEPLTFGPGDSASHKAAITYAAAPGEEVVISGGRPIGPWRKEGDLLVADVPDAAADKWSFRELFVGGERRPRARHPNEDYFRVVQAGPDNRTSFSFHPGDLTQIGALGEAEVVFLHDWSVSRIRIKAIDEKSHAVTFTDPIGASAPHYRINHFEEHPRYFVENAREYLDAPGEWFLDAAAGRLYCLPCEGETTENLEAVAPWLERLVEVQGDAQANRPVRGLRFKDLTFAYCRFDTPRRGYAEGQATFYEDRDGGERSNRGMVPAALMFDLAESCVLENCRFEHLGGSGVYFRQQCQDNRVTGCTFRDIAGNGALFGEIITRKAPDGRELVCRGNEISDCTIERCGELFYGAVGVWVGIAQGTTVAHNEIRNLPYTGVSVGWRWDTQPTGCRENVVRDNHIHHVMQILSDGGGVYTLGVQPGTRIAGNRIHDVPLNLGRAESNGMFIDEGSSQITIESNTIYNIERSPIRFHRAEHDTIRNNRLICAPGIPPFRYNNADPATMTIEGNEVLESKDWTPPADDPTASAGPR
jgi:hypothetical protein